MSARHVAMKPSWVGVPMIVALGRLGLRSNLRLCLDAGDDASYASGQSWLDTSGNGYDFFLGTTSGSQSTDPTFNGTAGRRSSGEYWSFDGGDYFTYDTTNETWMQNLHKDNATFTLAAWMNIATSPGGIVGTSGGSTSNVGFEFYAASGNLTYSVRAGGSSAISSSGTTPIPTSQWAFLAMSLNEAVGTNGLMFQVNGTQELLTSTYSSPSSSNATYSMQLGSRGNGNVPLPNGSRLASLCAWEGRVLSQGELRTLFQATRPRFGV